jgi:WD40 repeat protein
MRELTRAKHNSWDQSIMKRLLLWILLQAAPSAFAQTDGLPGGRVDRYGDPLPAGAKVRLGTTRYFVGATISSIAFAHDGQTLASLDESSSDVTIWDVKTGKKQRTLRPPNELLPDHGWGARVVSYSPNGRWLVSAYDDVVIIWDVQSGRMRQVFSGEFRGISDIFVSANSRFVGAFCHDRQVRIWDIDSGRETNHLPWLGRRHGLSPNGDRIAAITPDWQLHLWSVASGMPIRESYPIEGKVWAYSFDSDLNSLTEVNARGDFKIWNLSTGVSSAQGHLEAWATGSAPVFSETGAVLVVAGRDNHVRVWSLPRGRLIQDIVLRPWSQPDKVAVSHDGTRLALVSENDVSLDVRDVASGNQITSVEGHRGAVIGVAFSPDNRKVASSGEDGKLVLWNLATGRMIWEVMDAPAGFWEDPRDRLMLRQAWIDVCPTGAIAFDLEGSSVISVSRDGVVRFRSTVSARETHELRLTGAEQLEIVAFSADRRMLAGWQVINKTGAKDQYCVWSLSDGKEVGRYSLNRDRGIKSLSFSPDGREIASTDSLGKVCIWSVGDHSHRVLTIDDDVFVQSVAFLPESRSLALGCHDRGLALRSEEKGIVYCSPERIAGSVMGMTRSPDGSKVASSTEDNRLRACEVSSMREVANFAGHAKFISSLAFSSDSRLIATASQDGTVLVWEVVEPGLRAIPLK